MGKKTGFWFFKNTMLTDSPSSVCLKSQTTRKLGASPRYTYLKIYARTQRVSKNLKTIKQNHRTKKLIIDMHESSNMISMKVNIFSLIIFKFFFNSGGGRFSIVTLHF